MRRPNYIAIFLVLAFLNLIGWGVAYIFAEVAAHHPVYWIIVTIIAVGLNITIFNGMKSDEKDVVYKVRHEVMK